MTPSGSPPEHQPLTNREVQTLFWVIGGYTNQQIAAQLGVGETTIKTYMNRLFRKVGVTDRVQAAVLVFRLALGETCFREAVNLGLRLLGPAPTAVKKKPPPEAGSVIGPTGPEDFTQELSQFLDARRQGAAALADLLQEFVERLEKTQEPPP